LQEDIEQKIRETSLENINEVLSALRAQRHDYINHLNSIYSLLGQGKVEKVKEYIIGISKEIKNLGPPVNCDNIWISALLQSKKGTAQSQKINLEYEIRGKLDELPLSPWEISKVLGNLIDNSIEAVENQPDFARNVLVYIGESRDNFIFRVSNSGEAIPESEIKKIFKKGYTTKARGEGLGLSIVKSIVESYDGYVNVRSKEEITSFELIIPK
jgi:sensor histidine kinase regulating citrate/malate metabolism